MAGGQFRPGQRSQATGCRAQSIRGSADTKTSATQQSQIAECVAKNNAQALIVGAIRLDGLNNVIADYAGKGIPVIDLINGVSSDKVAAKSGRRFLRYGAGRWKIPYCSSVGHVQGGQGCMVSRTRRRGLGRGRRQRFSSGLLMVPRRQSSTVDLCDRHSRANSADRGSAGQPSGYRLYCRDRRFS